MSHTNNNTTKSETSNPVSNAPTDPADQLAHELANLLDGSLRHLGIAIDTLQETDPHESDTPSEHPASDPTDPQAIITRLQTTDRAMRQMSSLIHAWMKKAPKPREMFEQSQTLRQTLDQVIKLHQPSAIRHEIEICLTLGDGAADIPSGPMFPIVANALRNSIESIADDDSQAKPEPHRIDINVTTSDGDLTLTVSDNGPGLDISLYDADGQLQLGRSTKTNGHGLGLPLCQQIAASLQGTLELTPRNPHGTQLTLRCPIASLTTTNTTQANT
jgi:signal transduction histidine kinase